jgi:hypothetical protein
MCRSNRTRKTLIVFLSAAVSELVTAGGYPPAARLMFPFDQDYLAWFNSGVWVGLSRDLGRWAILPELGYSICLDESSIDPVFSCGIAPVFPTGR